MATRRRRSQDALSEALREAKREPRNDASRALLREGIEHSHWLPVTEAANIVGDAALDGFEAALIGVWPRFVDDGAKQDPGCRAKEAALTALDRLETFDSEPFLRAIRYQQFEPVFGGREDTAGGVRQRALSALFRLHHPDAPLYAGELLSDGNAHVRAGVVRALGYYGDRSAACLLVHKLHAGDPDPQVVADAAAALLRACSDFAIPVLSSWLRQSEGSVRECAAYAFGQSTSSEAIDLLIQWTEEGGWDRDIELGIRALGLGRSDRAREYLLGLVEKAAPARACKVVEVLAIHSYDERLAEQVRRAAGNNRSARLSALVDKLFPRSGG